MMITKSLPCQVLRTPASAHELRDVQASLAPEAAPARGASAGAPATAVSCGSWGGASSAAISSASVGVAAGVAAAYTQQPLLALCLCAGRCTVSIHLSAPALRSSGAQALSCSTPWL